MTMTVQLDLFNNVVPIATFDWADKYDLKLFDYSTDMQFDDVQLEGNYVINVPCYKVDSLVGIIDKNANPADILKNCMIKKITITNTNINKIFLLFFIVMN